MIYKRVGFEVLTAEVIKIFIFWDEIPSIALKINCHSGGTYLPALCQTKSPLATCLMLDYCLAFSSVLKMEATFLRQLIFKGLHYVFFSQKIELLKYEIAYLL
jgi:hypothetical protein